MLASRYFPAWYLGRLPTKQMILASATDELALNFSGQCRDTLIEHGSIFGPGRNVREDRRAAHRWELEAGGGLRAAGVGTALLGFGANCVVVDDFARSLEEALSQTQREKVFQWYLTTAETRLSPDGAVVIVCTRWHRKDLVGSILDAAAETGEHWEVIRLPGIDDRGQALWPSQWPLEKLERKRAGYYASGYGWQWEALYQQQPPYAIAAEFPKEWFEGDIWFDDYPESIRHRVVAVDPSKGKSARSDYSAIVSLALGHDGKLWCEADLERRNAVKIVEDTERISRAFKADAVAVEANAFQEILAELLIQRSRETGLILPVHCITNTVDKVVRIRGTLTPFLARREIRFRRTPGTRLLVEQLEQFPGHAYDDGPDGLEMAVRMMRHVFDAGIPAEPVNRLRGVHA